MKKITVWQISFIFLLLPLMYFILRFFVEFRNLQILDKISEHINKASDLVEKMIEARKICNNMDNTRTKAIAYQSQVKDTFFDEIRYNVDKLELLIDDKEWYLPKYREMLFLR